MSTRSKRLRSATGISLLDTVVTMSLGVILTAVAVPVMLSGTGSMALSTDARQIEQALQTARLRAIQSNVTVRVMFDCPVAGQFRMVQLLGTQALPVAPDGLVTRCDEIAYPYPPAASDVFYAPTANDGPIRRLAAKNSFVAGGSASKNFFEFWPDGTIHRDTGSYPLPRIALGAGVATTNVAVTNGPKTISITVNGNGKILDNR